ncbi:MAG: coenzyme F420-0:L-glutamate ligase [Armatimonadota bacterium]|nr:coenzyme F420-0:L-glutamate ligase [Armatimonadota bacterium]MDR7422751.1 coenzyme F420-0:L-glutamate ligase [Armatimonadota bacterium]MDR7454939.1 coenzyme F420-0:L-glutamate ligase [Armatimonadota bacterium]MDR7456608.1 coenzyme F420-0:L-glutamate ligase [Armatimonadota bacterium]MDR7497756.1 coenzyme F420-0:L-glutamate ligase [Armatimonadota bacterium]
MKALLAWAPEPFPEVRPGDDLVAAIAAALQAAGLAAQPGDVVVVAHKVVSKAEGCVVDLRQISPSPRALAVAEQARKDPRLVEVILRESVAVRRVRPGLIIAEHRLGFVCANAGVDHSNVGLGEEFVVTLPPDPDASAARLREGLRGALGADVAVIVNDSHGRPFRQGTTGAAIGAAGLEVLRSYVGEPDRYGYVLRVSVEAIADELAATANLLQGQAAEGRPVVLIRGAGTPGAGRAADLVRPQEEDLFR